MLVMAKARFVSEKIHEKYIDSIRIDFNNTYDMVDRLVQPVIARKTRYFR